MVMGEHFEIGDKVVFNRYAPSNLEGARGTIASIFLIKTPAEDVLYYGLKMEDGFGGWKRKIYYTRNEGQFDKIEERTFAIIQG